MTSPTTTSYPELEYVYNVFNQQLFGGQLPGVLITLQRKANTAGYYSPGRFINQQNQRVGELAMNPNHFRSRDTIDTLSTMVHEMVHVQQQHQGKPGRRGYHNKEFADMMQKIGLQTSTTGMTGGDTTGEKMTHFTIEGGLFQQVALGLVNNGFSLSWADYSGVKSLEDGAVPADPTEVKPVVRVLKIGRTRFSCPKCKVNAWGKPSLKIACAKCLEILEPNERVK